MAWAIRTFVVSDAWSRQQIDLVERFVNQPPHPDWPYLDAEDQTRTVCTRNLPCIQAVGNGYLTILKFSSISDARAHAESLGESGYQIDPLVVNFNGKPLGERVRGEIVDVLSGINAGSPS